MTSSEWHPFEEGGTIGRPGSDQGVTVRDEEHSLGARITLERDCGVAAFAITCGIYGWMMHTRFFSSEGDAEAQYALMKGALDELMLEAERTAPVDGGKRALYDGIDRFIGDYP